MRRILITIVFTLSFAFVSKAQYVNIPDSNFRKFLIGKYPSCFNASKQMDTNCSLIVNETKLNLYVLNVINIDEIKYFKKLRTFSFGGNLITNINYLPDSIRLLDCGSNKITFINYFPNKIDSLYLGENLLTTLPKLPDSLKVLSCWQNKLSSLPTLPNSLKELSCFNNKLTNLPALPNSLKKLSCFNNQLTNIPNIPINLTLLDCSFNKLISLPPMNNLLNFLNCESNQITSFPILPISLAELKCNNNKIGYFTNLPANLTTLDTYFNTSLSSLPTLPKKLSYLSIWNTNIKCLPLLPPNLKDLYCRYGVQVKCLPNIPLNCNVYDDNFLVVKKLSLCNIINPNNCTVYPQVLVKNYIDFNKNLLKDSIEYPKSNLKFSFTNNNYSFTNAQGIAYINADSLGTYTITAIPPAFYNAVPASYTHTFNTYDTIVYDTFALQPTVLKDSIAIKLTPTNWAARAGRAYPYLVSYENVGTTVLSNAIIGLQYDNSLLGYDSSSNHSAANSGSNLSLNIGNVMPGQTGNFMAYFTVKTTAALGTSLVSNTNINTASVAANDTSKTLVIGSYDPNDKQATPLLTTKQVTDGNFIDYTIRFQNTGTDTAFNVVIADTLDSKLQANQVQIIGSSHSCKTTLKDNVIFFEFLDIMLLDSNKNKLGSNGFVSFKIKPVSSVTNGTNIPNKAAIYFDYNSPIITKAANTLIQNPLPLQLLSFKASPTPPKEGLKNWSVIASWTTLNEVNTSHFILLRSDDGIIYKSVGSIAAKGFGEYNFIDNSLSSTFKTIYYQLKMVDKNGQFTFSNVIKINSVVEKLSTLIVLNNPAKNTLQLQVNAATLNNTTASLINNEGKVIKIFMLKQGFQTIDISGFACGVYYLKTIDRNEKVLIGK